MWPAPLRSVRLLARTTLTPYAVVSRYSRPAPAKTSATKGVEVVIEAYPRKPEAQEAHTLGGDPDAGKRPPWCSGVVSYWLPLALLQRVPVLGVPHTIVEADTEARRVLASSPTGDQRSYPGRWHTLPRLLHRASPESLPFFVLRPSSPRAEGSTLSSSPPRCRSPS